MTQPSNPPFASKLGPMCNAWILLNEDEPPGTNYDSPSSVFQRSAFICRATKLEQTISASFGSK